MDSLEQPDPAYGGLWVLTIATRHILDMCLSLLILFGTVSTAEAFVARVLIVTQWEFTQTRC